MDKVLNEKVKRPLNPFIIYLIDIRKELNYIDYKFKQNDICKIGSILWSQENINIKNQYIEKSKIYKKEHYLRYPNYKFNPKKRLKKKRNIVSK